jgi:hypothetical protein
MGATMPEGSMKEHCSGHSSYGEDASLSNTILVCSTRPSKPNLLSLGHQFIEEFLGCEDTIVSVIVLNDYSIIIS